MSDQQQKKSKPRRKNEEAILAAAEEVFADLGFAGATTGLIAKRAGIPKANLHYYFPTKEALYRTITSKVFTTWFEAAKTFDDCDDPTEALTRYIRAKMNISFKHPLGSKVCAQEIMQGAPQIQDFLEKTLKDWTASRILVIERWIAEGKINAIDPHYLLYMIWGTTQHYADFAHQITTLNNGRPLSDQQKEEAQQTVINIILRGIGLSPQ
ncbi:MAG: TetR family transcriptional regulator [Rhodospirillaceae bacterium]|jgi:TetR/AcrR family transcriptional regulator|nr:TetR family transcriptional regulator [Rhodospirillaceae bacterium]MBT5243606.1 TetR family transcriptional regulator [Rhodospirillaceae bacterium]MBT5562194.1 TetR family transcriptional regulator [Rhodospirillaceae bacterium]MBT6242367.1 TetR family transcriptional regulator [Rhodospirillaceae bacterium]MBT7138927.1 TetR family transcriptional regulator [Rhodospirillaceae bacterium]